jgi:galactokinase/mevalonate kinase-like predicted kinase
MAAYAAREDTVLPDWFVAADPPGPKPGSGGGTAYLLTEAWRAESDDATFRDWLDAGRTIVLHGGGESRRLPAYGAVGKPLIPLPIAQDQPAQRTGRQLIDEQQPVLESLLDAAPGSSRVMIASGDILLRYGCDLPRFPAVDVLALGMTVEPDVARNFGVFFSPLDMPGRVSFFLQKPTVETICEHAANYRFLVDTGVWLLSRRAVEVLMAQCGWVPEDGVYADGRPGTYELYASFGPALGTDPVSDNPDLAGLTTAVVALPEPTFLHFGTSRQLVESAASPGPVAGSVPPESESGCDGSRVVVNSVCEAPLDGIGTVWIEGADVSSGWRLAGCNVVTGVSDISGSIDLASEVCLDLTPLDDGSACLRWYGIDDRFSGDVDDPDTLWCGTAAGHWFDVRDMDISTAGIAPGTDIQCAPLFPADNAAAFDSAFVSWLIAETPDERPEFRDRWLAAKRLSAHDIRTRIDCERYMRERLEMERRFIAAWYEREPQSAASTLDLAAAARLFDANTLPVRRPDAVIEPIAAAGDAMFRSTVLNASGADGAEEVERAFTCLGDGILASLGDSKAQPVCGVQSDQIVWARSPVRLDLAGGWTDTPPHCLRHGGRVTNVAMDLNGQPPIQVFVRRTDEMSITIRSIDLGLHERITGYDALDNFAVPGSGFAIAKAALALAGFLPRFHVGEGESKLESQLGAFGGGIELTMLAAVPQGSGLGTSSILSATVLGALNEFCRLEWDTERIMRATLALEQLLTTGGGWQDQTGGILHGVKLVESSPGLRQDLSVRWLPDFLFRDPDSASHMLLYYTGITRMAKNILLDIVERMFLGDAGQLAILRDIADTAAFTAEALQENDLERTAEGIARSWDLNRRLDPGTDPPAVRALIDPIKEYAAGLKLLGAGGGGYLIVIAKDADAAGRIRRTLIDSPPNDRARFISMTPSVTGMDVTTS